MRFLALGLDRLAGVAGEEDNEPTGLHMSEGDSTIHGLIGTREFRKDRAMLFFTQQHGENNLFEVFPRRLSRTDRPRQAGSAPDGKPSGAFFCAQ